jgi:hypothetical protein
MPWHWWLALALAVAAAAGLTVLLRPLLASWRQARFDHARRDFHRQRERLEAKFLQIGQNTNRPGAPRWLDCGFEDDVAYARSRSTGELSALVGVTIQMEIVPENGLPGEGPSQFRAGTAVFCLRRGRWETEGKAILNLTPTEAIRFYHRDLEMVGQEVAQHL